MKIVKSIRLSEDNIQEIMDCPVVYRISKLELEPKGEIADANLCTQLKPTILVYVQGYKEPCKANGDNHLFVMEDGIWRCLPKEVMEWFLDKANSKLLGV